MSNNGIMVSFGSVASAGNVLHRPKVRVLDTPGLADTRGIQQDALHKRSIVTQIKEHINSVTAVIVVANGAVPRVTVGTDYALSTLSAILPKSLASKTAFMFTNVSSPLHWNVSGDSLPVVLKDAPQFLLNNPVALQREYTKLKYTPNMNKELRNAVKAGEQNALEMLVHLFDWLDGLKPQSMTEVVSLYEKTQVIEGVTTNALAQMNQAAAMGEKIKEQMRKLQSASVVRFSICPLNHMLIGRRTWRHAPTNPQKLPSGSSGRYPDQHIYAIRPSAIPTAVPPAFLPRFCVCYGCGVPIATILTARTLAHDTCGRKRVWHRHRRTRM